MPASTATQPRGSTGSTQRARRGTEPTQGKIWEPTGVGVWILGAHLVPAGCGRSPGADGKGRGRGAARFYTSSEEEAVAAVGKERGHRCWVGWRPETGGNGVVKPQILFFFNLFFLEEFRGGALSILVPSVSHRWGRCTQPLPPKHPPGPNSPPFTPKPPPEP